MLRGLRNVSQSRVPFQQGSKDLHGCRETCTEVEFSKIPFDMADAFWDAPRWFELFVSVHGICTLDLGRKLKSWGYGLRDG